MRSLRCNRLIFDPKTMHKMHSQSAKYVAWLVPTRMGYTNFSITLKGGIPATTQTAWKSELVSKFSPPTNFQRPCMSAALGSTSGAGPKVQLIL